MFIFLLLKTLFFRFRFAAGDMELQFVGVASPEGAGAFVAQMVQVSTHTEKLLWEYKLFIFFRTKKKIKLNYINLNY